jgi:FkbM family methyltransferase
LFQPAFWNIEGNTMENMLNTLIRKVPLYRFLEERRNIRGFGVLSERETRCLEFYRQFIRPGDLVFDVGANMGSRTKVFLNLGARVVAFEPQKVCVDFLRSALKNRENFTLVEAALGKKEGEMEMLISNAHTISTLSQQWVKATKQSGRFARYEWNKTQSVAVTTLDIAIEKFGAPAFVKIDVEGYEFEVLSGLTSPVRCMSIEFAAEHIENTYRCVEYANLLSKASFQIAAGESMEFQLPAWVSAEEIKRILAKLSEQDKLAWGDVYIRHSGTDA